jgi:hypothetical protein
VYFDLVIRSAIGGTLIVSALYHLANPYRFLASIYDYDLVGPVGGTAIAMALPSVELVLGVFLVCRFFHRTALFLSCCLLCGLVLVQLSAVARGLKMDCGCFPIKEAQVGGITLILALSLMFLGALDLWLVRDARDECT